MKIPQKNITNYQHIVITVSIKYFIAVEDMEKNDGTSDKPYYATKDLLEILNKKNTAEVEEARQ